MAFFSYAAAVTLLIACIYNYQDTYVYLNGHAETGKVMVCEPVYGKWDGEQRMPLYYKVRVDNFPYTIQSDQQIALHTTFHYLTTGETPSWLGSYEAVPAAARQSRHPSDYFLFSVAGAGCAIAFIFLMAGLGQVVICFVRSRFDRTDRMEQGGRLVLGILNFITVMELSIVLVKTVYNAVPSRWIGGVAVFGWIILMRCTPFFEAILLFLLRLSFDEPSGTGIRVARMLIKVVAGVLLVWVLSEALRDLREPVWKLIWEWIDKAFG